MTWPIEHGCGAVITEEQWPTLHGRFVWAIEDSVVLENRLCPGEGCGSHISIDISGEGQEEAT